MALKKVVKNNIACRRGFRFKILALIAACLLIIKDVAVNANTFVYDSYLSGKRPNGCGGLEGYVENLSLDECFAKCGE